MLKNHKALSTMSDRTNVLSSSAEQTVPAQVNENKDHEDENHGTIIQELKLLGTPPAQCTSKSSSLCVTSLEEETSSVPVLLALTSETNQTFCEKGPVYTTTQLSRNTSVSNGETIALYKQTYAISSRAESSDNENHSSGSKFGQNYPESANSSWSTSQINSGSSFDTSKAIDFRPTSSKVAEMGKRKKQKSEMFVINFGPATKPRASSGNLQDSFQRFQKMKMEQMKHQRKMRRAQRKRLRLERAKPENMWSLRMKFIAELKKYLGVPYAKRYFTPEDPEYESKIFLDCCGLVRRALWNMQYLFGFRIGPWNQAYMFDTLPIDVEDEKDMKPGDLVFISGVYNDGVKLKNSPHNMKHIEVWLGQGQRVIGSRWQRGTVSIFDTYKFESKTYHNMVYHFKSIDTWLKGYCKSVCSEHPWKLKRPIMFSEKSIFASNLKTGAKPAKQSSTSKLPQTQTSKNKKQTTKKKKKPSIQKRPQTAHGDIVTGTTRIEDPIESCTLQDGYSNQQSQIEKYDEFMAQFDEMEGAEDCINDGMGEEFEQGQMLQEDSEDEDDDDDESPTDDEFDVQMGQKLKIF